MPPLRLRLRLRLRVLHSMAEHQHEHDLAPWQHDHDFAVDRSATERRAWAVVAITVVMMAAEIAAGWWWHSMALLADGWHMGTHAVAIGVAGVSYWLARRWAGDRRFSLGPWKIEILGAYTSAVLLAVVAASVAFESMLRLLHPTPVAYDESLLVAGVGLVVNAVCAWLLQGSGEHAHHGHGHGHAHGRDDPGHDHDRGHDHDDDHDRAHDHDHDHDCDRGRGRAGHRHDHGSTHGPADHRHAHAHAPADRDLNREAAYAHVLADAATSLLAIGALLAGKWLGWTVLDPLVGLLGAVLIAWWARGLIAHSATILLDREMDHPLGAAVRRLLESDGDTKVADLHLWRVGGDAFACAATLVADAPRSADAYRERLRGLPSLAHVILEVNHCRQAPARERP